LVLTSKFAMPIAEFLGEIGKATYPARMMPIFRAKYRIVSGGGR
jgi:hypothetical protein